MKRFLVLALVYSFFISGTSYSLQANPTSYETPTEFWNLYYDFVSRRAGDPKKGSISASKTLIDSMKNPSSQEGALVIVMGSNLYIYNSLGIKLLDYPIRASRKNGFFEMTAISHIGPALAYYAKAKANGSNKWLEGLLSILANVETIQKLNAQDQDLWIDKVQADSWQPYKQKIRNMVDYACRLTAHYIRTSLKEDNFNLVSLEKNFYSVSNQDYPVPFNNIMIGTFMVVALEAVHSMNKAFANLDLEWSQAKVLIKFIPGKNLTAGLTKESNWLVPTFKGLSADTLPDNRVMIAPFMEEKKDLGDDILSKETLAYYQDRVWGVLYASTFIARTVFDFIPSLDTPKPRVLPGNYEVTSSDNIEDFVTRLKYSLENETEMLSNTTAFWIAKEYAAKNGQLNNLDIPGLNKGFPNGVESYPELKKKTAQSLLKIKQSLLTSGAREVKPFTIGGKQYLAVPQLAYDDLSKPASMNGGKDAHVVIYKINNQGVFEEYQKISGHHNESAEPFVINGQQYLAVCSVAKGSDIPYNNHTTQYLYKWNGKKFEIFQTFKGYAAKSWTYFEMQGKHYLALANGVLLPGKPKEDTRSYLFVWNGKSFESLQSFDTDWAYKFTQFNIGKRSFLALTDHLKDSKIHEWDGLQFRPFQSFDSKGGRVFHHFKIGANDYIALANIFSDSTVHRWDGKKFELVQSLKGQGTRNFLHFKSAGKDYLLKIVFITGTRENPESEQDSPIYLFENGKFHEVSHIQTSGAVSAHLFELGKKKYIALANSLTKAIRFAATSVIYEIQG